MARTPFSGDVSVDLLSDDGDADEHAFFTPAPLGRGGTLGAAAAFDARSRSPTPRAANTKQLPARHSGGAKASPAKPRVSLGGHDDLGRSRESLGGRGARATDVSPAVSQAPSSTQAGPGFGLKQTEKVPRAGSSFRRTLDASESTAIFLAYRRPEEGKLFFEAQNILSGGEAGKGVARGPP